MQMHRILIIGISGTGKTVLARALSHLLSIPATHYDKLVWQEDWNEVSEDVVTRQLGDVIKKDQWIIEGFIHPAAQSKLERADTVIYLDYSGPRAAFGGLRRWWQYRGRVRPELAAGCVERFDWDYLKVMWRRGERPEIEEAIKGFEDKIVRLKTKKQLNQYLKSVSGA